METENDTFKWSVQTQMPMADHAAGLGRAFESSQLMLIKLRQLVERGASIQSNQQGVFEIETKKPELHCSTSGSMGHPKTICRRPTSWQKSFVVNAGLFDLTAQDHFVIFGSLGHSLALYGALEAAHLGADISTLHGVRPDKQADFLERLNATVLYITPTQLGQLIAAKHLLPQIRHVMVGGGKLNDALRVLANEMMTNAKIIEFYGASETSFITMTNPTTPNGSVGRAYPQVEIRIDATDSEIWVKSPYLFERYIDVSCESMKDGFVATGELGNLDENGNLFLKGRKGRMITIADQNVHPENAEAILKANLKTDRVAVLAATDQKRGHVLEAVFCASLGTDQCHDAMSQCRAQLGAVKSPRQFHLINEFPLLEAGKPDLARLQEWLKDQS